MEAHCAPARKAGSRKYSGSSLSEPEHDVLGLDPVEPDLVREQREREDSGETVRVPHPRRQEARRGDIAVVEVRAQGHHIVQRELAGEQIAADADLPVFERPAES